VWRSREISKSYELFITAMPRTLEDNWNEKNMKTFGDKPSINCVKLTYCEVAEAIVLTFMFSNVDNSICYICRTFLHFDVKCKFQYLFQELLFFRFIIVTTLTRGFCVQRNTIVYVILEIIFHFYALFVIKVVGFVGMSIKHSPFLWDPGI
jgi:hypothetical protein